MAKATNKLENYVELLPKIKSDFAHYNESDDREKVMDLIGSLMMEILSLKRRITLLESAEQLNPNVKLQSSLFDKITNEGR